MSHFQQIPFTGGKPEFTRVNSLFISVRAVPLPSMGSGLFPPHSSLKYRLSCAELQKHLNLRWQECVQLISSTVAPSSGFLLHNTEHHRKSQSNTLKHNRHRLRGAVPICPAHCHDLLSCYESHPLFHKLLIYTISQTLVGNVVSRHTHTHRHMYVFLTFCLKCFCFSI